MTDLVFIDTETTSLRPDRRAWEIGLIERVPVTVKHPDGPDTQATEDREHHWFIDIDDLELGNADPMALKIGRFYERHPQMRGQRSAHPLVKPEYIVLEEAEAIIRGAHLVGAVVSFDADVLDRRMRAHGICPSWHYHLIDVEALAIGYLRGRGWPKAHWGDPEARSGEAFDPAQLPWKSDDLSAALGVTVSDEDRHTALGDAKWAMRVYDAVMGGTS